MRGRLLAEAAAAPFTSASQGRARRGGLARGLLVSLRLPSTSQGTSLDRRTLSR